MNVVFCLLNKVYAVMVDIVSVVDQLVFDFEVIDGIVVAVVVSVAAEVVDIVVFLFLVLFVIYVDFLAATKKSICFFFTVSPFFSLLPQIHIS